MSDDEDKTSTEAMGTHRRDVPNPPLLPLATLTDHMHMPTLMRKVNNTMGYLPASRVITLPCTLHRTPDKDAIAPFKRVSPWEYRMEQLRNGWGRI